MNSYEKTDIFTKRQYLVVKSNELIQKSRFKLSLSEQKAVAFICSMIQPSNSLGYDKDLPFQLDYEFYIRDYCKICGIDYDNGKNYIDIKVALKHLRDQSIWLTLIDGSETLVAWLDRVIINKKSGLVKIRIDDRLAPYLFELKQKFTQYQLYNILAMKSSFSIRLYEIMKSYAFQKSKVFSLEELKHLLMVDNIKSYKDFSPFRQKVLEVAECEINKLTDLNISFQTITKGRKVIKIKFFIQRKDTIQQWLAEQVSNNKLGDFE